MSIRRKIFLSLLIFIMAWSILEFMAYHHISDAVLPIMGKETTSFLMPDAKLFWKLTPNSVSKMDWGQVMVDSTGLRGRYPGSMRGRAQRILCLGDSVTFGWRVDEAGTYPRQLQDRLDILFPNTFAVFNAGVPGYTSYQGQIALPKLLKRLQPNLVVISFSINDRFPAEHPDAVRDNQFRALKHYLRISCVFRALELQLTPVRKGFTSNASQLAVSDATTHRVPVSEFHDNLLTMIQGCKVEGCQVILMNEYVNSLPMPYDAYHEILDSIARSEELPLIDAVALLKPRDIQTQEPRQDAPAQPEWLIAESLPEPSSSSLRQNTLLQPFNPQVTDQDTPTIMDETVPASDRQKLILLPFDVYDPWAGVMVDPYHPNPGGYAILTNALLLEIIDQYAPEKKMSRTMFGTPRERLESAANRNFL